MHSTCFQKKSDWKAFFWPIEHGEYRKLLPMIGLFFLVSFIYHLLRCMKVTLVVTAEGSGAEVIPYLKVWGVLPAAVILTSFYAWLSNHLTREQIFYTLIAGFLSFFLLFILVIHPYRAALELNDLAQWLQSHLPVGLKGLISALRHWPLSLFYIFSELWGGVVLSVLLWGFANEITTISESKRFYAIFAVSANLSGIFSGQFARLLTFDDYKPYLPGRAAWEQSLFVQVSAVLLMGGLILGVFWWLNRHLSTAELARAEKKHQAEQVDQAKESKLSLKECFTHLAKEPSLIYIGVLVLSYYVVYNLSDILCTDQIHRYYPKATDFNSYINNMTSVTGVCSTVVGLFLPAWVIRRYGWKGSALVSPLIWGVAGIGFFACVLFGNHLGGYSSPALLSQSMAVLALAFGTVQACLGRASKFTFFDQSKEMAFLPLSKESKRKGKAAVDGVFSRLGKSGGSVMIQGLLFFCGELIAVFPYVAVIFFTVIIFWLIAVQKLNRIVGPIIDEKEKGSSLTL